MKGALLALLCWLLLAKPAVSNTLKPSWEFVYRSRQRKPNWEFCFLPLPASHRVLRGRRS